MEDVTPDALRQYLGVSQVDEERATLLLALAREACEEIVDPLPERARGVVLDVASSAYVATPGPGGQQTAGPFTAPMAPGGITLSPRQERRLRRLSGRRTGAFSVDTVAGHGPPAGDYYVPDDDGLPDDYGLDEAIR